jgi:Sortase domain
MTTRTSGKDRTPARRAVPALLAAGLLLLNAWLLLAIGRQDHQPHPQPLNADGPTSITIPAIGVHAPIVAVGLQADGAMQLPDPGQVGWYRLGPRPGAPGPAVLVGHVDNRTGPDVFYRLRQLRPGDQILIGDSDGTTSRFLVGRLEQRPKTALLASRIFTPTHGPQLHLVTCAGHFNRATGHYLDNLIVFASPTSS